MAVTDSIVDNTELTRVGLRAFFNIADKWQLRSGQQQILLGSPNRPTLTRWREWADTPKGHCRNSVPRDVLERISYVMGIYKALSILNGAPDIRDSWVHRENDAPGFGGRTPLERMLGGNVADLAEQNNLENDNEATDFYTDTWHRLARGGGDFFHGCE